MKNEALKLPRQRWARDDIWELLAQIDEVVILVIDLGSTEHRLRYRVFGPKSVNGSQAIPEATRVLRAFAAAGATIRGVALQDGHYSCLFPIDEQPNFAGANALNEFE